MNPSYPHHPFGERIDKAALQTRLEAAQGWEAKNRLLVQLGRELPDWPATLRDDAHLVSGCESRVWLHGEYVDGQLRLYADSDSRIVKGLLALVLTAYCGQTAEMVARFDAEAWLQTLGLQRFVSASRGNGLRAIIRHIREYR
ncbi:SufE family protein [Chitinilyticum litopenaei]|uniref:SufE family protein n=1 Tax=Chitinilyticum litopenaei TaxID=1121276 RepID=UPI000428AA37|nr:SufE family protein [Chitinilyticum litopenaei]